MSHATHSNAALTPRARLRLARLIVDHDWPPARAAERYDVSWQTADKWAERYRAEGPAGMIDRSSRPHRQPNRTPAPVVRKIVHLRWKQRLGPVEIGDRLGMPSSTVHAVLVRCRLNRLTHIDRATGEPIRRYEHERPGDLIHVDVKKLGRVPDGGGWRYVGRQQGEKNRSATAARTGAPSNKYRHPLIGTCYLHTVIDDHSRVAYVEAHDDETKETAAAVLRNAVAWFADRGVTVQRVLVRQRQLLPVPPVARHLRRARHHPQANPALPAPDQRQDRTLPPHPGRGLGLQEVLHLRVSPTRRSASMGPPVQPPPAPLSNREGRTHHQVGQPGWASHLATARAPKLCPQPRPLSEEAGRRSVPAAFTELTARYTGLARHRLESPRCVATMTKGGRPRGGRPTGEPGVRLVRAQPFILAASSWSVCCSVSAMLCRLVASDSSAEMVCVAPLLNCS